MHDEGIKWVTCQYFSEPFTTQGWGMSQILLGIPIQVTDGMNDFLQSRFREDQVVAALYSMSPTKVSGDNGMPALFL